MTIGTSLGAFYEDEYHYQAREFLKKNRPNENREVDPKNDRTKGDENIIDPGTKTEDFITPVDYKTASPLVTITDEDIDKGMNLGMAFAGSGLVTKPVIGYKIIQRNTGEQIGTDHIISDPSRTTTVRRRVDNKIDKLDNEYGSYNYRREPIYGESVPEITETTTK